MQIHNLKDLVQEYENGKLFNITGHDNKPIKLNIETQTLIELEHLISYYQLTSIQDPIRARSEWALLTECIEGIYVPEDGICPSCNTDLVQHYIATNQANGLQCPVCNYDFTAANQPR